MTGMDDDNDIDCQTHGRVPSSIVCQHLLYDGQTKYVGFILEEDAPDDLMAWCHECDARLLESGWTNDVLAFADLKVVCQPCLLLMRDAQKALAH
jgi:hypothetical protein